MKTRAIVRYTIVIIKHYWKIVNNISNGDVAVDLRRPLRLSQHSLYSTSTKQEAIPPPSRDIVPRRASLVGRDRVSPCGLETLERRRFSSSRRHAWKLTLGDHSIRRRLTVPSNSLLHVENDSVHTHRRTCLLCLLQYTGE